MRNLRIAVGLIAIAVGLAALATAQTVPAAPSTAQVKGQKHVPRIMEEREILSKLDLTETQKGQIKDMVTDLMSKLKAARQEAKGSADKSALHEKTRGLWKEYEQSLRSILNRAQQAQYKRFHKEYREKAAAAAAANGSGGGH